MTARAALVVAAVATTTCALAVPALAYPPGTDPVVQTAAGGYTVGTAIPVSVSNLAPGCEVQFTVSLNGQTVTSLGSTTNKKGTANATVPAPADAGAYTVTAHGVPSTTRSGTHRTQYRPFSSVKCSVRPPSLTSKVTSG